MKTTERKPTGVGHRLPASIGAHGPKVTHAGMYSKPLPKPKKVTKEDHQIASRLLASSLAHLNTGHAATSEHMAAKLVEFLRHLGIDVGR